MAEKNNILESYIENRYKKAIDYYWQASRSNKRAYKLTRSLTVILGALVTLVASLSSASFIVENEFWNCVFKLGTPFIAASLTIITGFSQSFQWGATWQDMVLTAQCLQKELDRFLITKPGDRDLVKEAALLNDFVIKESQGFFGRMLGSIRSVNAQNIDLQLKPEEDTEIEITGEPFSDKQSKKS